MAHSRCPRTAFPFEARSLALFGMLTLGLGSANAQSAQTGVGPDDKTKPPSTSLVVPAGGESRQALFSRADKNHDGSLSRDELAQIPSLDGHFDEIDLNHDGKITLQEFEQALSP